MQKYRIIQNLGFSGITSDINSGITMTKGEQLVFSNNYFSYKTINGGEIVNDNNVRNFLDKPENESLAENFVNFLQSNTNFTEFKEIFYDNKKLAHTFNEYYKNNYLPDFNQNSSIQESLIYTSGQTNFNNNFSNYQNRISNQINSLVPVPMTGDSYFVNLKIDRTTKVAPKGDYSEYFKDCIKGTYVDEIYSYINNISINTIYANIPYITQNKNKSFSYGYSPIENIDFSKLKTPVFAGMGRSGFNFQFLDFSQFLQHFNFQPQQLIHSSPGTFISQDRILINNNSTFSQTNNNYYYQNLVNFTAQFEINPMVQFEKNIYSSITVPFTVKLSQPSIGNTTLYVQAEIYSTAILGYDFFTNTQLLPYNQKTLLFNNGVQTINDYILFTNKISPEDTVVLSLRDSSNTVLGFLILRCEEFIEVNNFTDNSYLLIESIYRNKLFLNCFVDYNYNNDDMEFYRNYNIATVNNSNVNSGRGNRLPSNSNFDLNRIIQLTRLSQQSIRNIYFIGSRIYQTNNIDSDYDFTVVADTAVSEQVFNDGLYQVKVLSVAKYNSDLQNCEFPTIETRFLPDYAKIKEDITSVPEINLQRLHDAVERKIEYHNKLIKNLFKRKNSYYTINKLIFHNFRIILFATEIAKNGAITDFTIANNYYNFGLRYNFNSFEEMEFYVNPVINSLKFELQNQIKKSIN